MVLSRFPIQRPAVGVLQVFGADHFDDEDTSVQITTSTSFQEALSLVASASVAGRYRLGWNYCWNHDDTYSDFEARIQQDDTTDLMFHKEEPQESGGFDPAGTGSTQRFLASGFVLLDLSPGSYTFDLDFRTDSFGNESSIIGARLEFWRVSNA